MPERLRSQFLSGWSVEYLQYLFALLFVLSLIGGLNWLLRRYGGRLHGVALPTSSRKRLKLVEVMPLDSRRRLVLIRRDSMEHLLVLGPENCTLVEQGITPPEKEELSPQ